MASTWLVEHSRLAGYPTLNHLFRDLGIDNAGSKYRWGQPGYRPEIQWVLRLADALSVDLNDVLLGLWDEVPGQPCICGCGGSTMVPTNPKSTHFHVRRECQDCKEVAVFYVSRTHSARCDECVHRRVTVTCPDCHVDRVAKRSEVQRAISKGTITEFNWESLSATRRCAGCARAVKWPAARMAPRVTLTCPDCSETRVRLPSEIRYLQSRAKSQRAVIDRDDLTGISRCKRCNDAARFPDLVRKHGRSRARAVQSLRERGFGATRGGAGLLAMHAAVRGKPKSPSHLRALAISKLDPYSPMNKPLVWCELCGFIKARGGRWHQRCLRDWRRGRPGLGVGRFTFPDPPDTTKGGRPRWDPNETYAMAVMARQGDSHGEIASRFGTSGEVVRKRVDAFPKRIADDARGGAWLANIKDLLVS